MTQQCSPFAFGKPITLDNLDELFAHHRGITGGWSMEAGADDGGSDDGGKQDDPPKFDAITSQEELDRRIGARLAREREKFADYEDLKTKAAELEKIRQANQTEQEKAVEAARKEGESAALTTANARIISAEARALAATAGFHNPATAAKLLDLSAVTVDADGNVDEAAIKAKLDELATAEPYLIGAADGGKKQLKADRTQGGAGGGEDKPSLDRGRAMFENRRGGKKAS